MRTLLSAVVGMLLILSSAGAEAYDAALAKKADDVFSKLDRKMLTTSPCKVNPDVVLKWMKDGEKVTLVDIRTPEEMAIMSVSYKNSLKIPFNEIFKEDNLKKLPKDGKVLLVCHSGFRAGAASAVLKMIGVENVLAVNGGMMEFIKVLTPFTAP